MAEYIEYVNHCKKKLERGGDDEKTFAILLKLKKIPISVNLLQETGIGKTVRGLKSRQGEVGELAQHIYENWRKAVIDTSQHKGKEESKHKKTTNDVHKESSKQLLVENHKISYAKQSAVSNNAKLAQNHYSSNKNDSQNQKKYKSLGHDTHMKDRSSLSSNFCNYSTSNDNNNNYYTEEMEDDDEINISNTHFHKKSEKVNKNNYDDKKTVYKQKSSKNDMSMKKEENSHSQKKNKKLKRQLLESKEESFNSSVASFEDILGLNDSLKVKRKKPMPSTQTTKKFQEPQFSTENEVKKSTTTSKNDKTNKVTINKTVKKSVNKCLSSGLPDVPEALKKSKLVPLDEVDILSTLPPIQPNYKPLPHKDLDYLSKKKRTSMFLLSKLFGKMKYGVPTLYEACVRVLIENIDALAYTGGVPYFLLKPVLQRCNPIQLYSLEDYNPDLLEDTDELWEIHCKREFRNTEPDEDETWRELYLRKYDERESKLKSVTANISASMAKATQVRQTKLAYVDSVAKPPRDVARRQAKHGTGLSIITPVKPGQHKITSHSSKISVVNSSSSLAAPSSSSLSSSSSVQPRKPRVAPLMQKTLKLMKQHFRR
ncbi:transcription elongation factor B polypeptide 3-like [Centruroides sculpturatus]|uniref:transcription elongation factor B polypeptide 3-like n=1 Tax=Centruroides sculpturatus TaxID=218467 RepID=UPI000C6DBFBD|nr:transcription elongation factor B polypeptide 3-like [Centruroides sculpturatus]